MTSAVYLDYAGTTPLRAVARDAMVRAWDVSGNASAVHGAGRAARRIVEEAREQIAALLGAHPIEVLFTSGGTEADNLAIRGVSAALTAADGALPRLLTTAIEHDAIAGPAARLARAGAEVTHLPVGPDGLLAAATLVTELRRTPAGLAVLLSIQAANPEVGAVQDLPTLIAAARSWRSEHGGDGPAPLVIHSDAVQAAGHLSLDFAGLGLDAMSISAHKFGGPGGVGALIVRRGTPLHAIADGGGHERGLRPGTYDVAGIAGMAAALAEACGQREAETARVRELRDELATVLLAIDGVTLTGPALDDCHPSGTPARLPGNLHVTVDGARSELLLFALDAAGISASAGSACHAGVTEPSRVVLALGVPEALAEGALRFTLGHSNTRADIAAVSAAWPGAVSAARAASGAGRPASAATSEVPS